MLSYSSIDLFLKRETISSAFFSSIPKVSAAFDAHTVILRPPSFLDAILNELND